MSQEIRDGLTVLGLLERGNVTADLTANMAEVLKTLGEVAANQKKVKGSIMLKLSLEVENGAVRVDAEFSTKTPKVARPSTLFFLTADGALSLDHPTQMTMFPREVNQNRPGLHAEDATAQG